MEALELSKVEIQAVGRCFLIRRQREDILRLVGKERVQRDWITGHPSIQEWDHTFVACIIFSKDIILAFKKKNICTYMYIYVDVDGVCVCMCMCVYVYVCLYTGPVS